MKGPEIIARSLSATRIPDKFGNLWQYHSRSDRHSKVACWAVLFDLLHECSLLRAHAALGKVGFGINHEMQDFQTRRKKNLDLVVCTPNPSAKQNAGRVSFASLAKQYDVILESTENSLLAALPEFPLVPVGSVNIALEAKATMTAHIKALPRLHDELDSSHLTIHGNADHALAGALVLVNLADEFVSPGLNQRKLRRGTPASRNLHEQPNAAQRTIEKIHEIRRRVQATQSGFDAIGILLVEFRNDGSDCRLVTAPPAPAPLDAHHYGQMIRRLSAGYTSKFSTL